MRHTAAILPVNKFKVKNLGCAIHNYIGGGEAGTVNRYHTMLATEPLAGGVTNRFVAKLHNDSQDGDQCRRLRMYTVLRTPYITRIVLLTAGQKSLGSVVSGPAVKTIGRLVL